MVSREDVRSEEFRVVVLIVVVFLSLSLRSEIFLRSLSFSGKYGTASSYIFRAEKFSPLAACCSVFIVLLAGVSWKYYVWNLLASSM